MNVETRCFAYVIKNDVVKYKYIYIFFFFLATRYLLTSVSEIYIYIFHDERRWWRGKKKLIETRMYYRIIVISIMARSLEKNVLCLPVRDFLPFFAQLPDESTLGCPCLHVKLFKRLSVNSLHFSYSREEKEKDERTVHRGMLKLLHFIPHLFVSSNVCESFIPIPSLIYR